MTVRVLMLVDLLGPDSGGAERVAVQLAQHLPRDRFSVSLCATRAVEAPWVDALASRGVRWFALGRRSSADVRPFMRLGRLLRRERVDVLHAHMFGSNVWGTVVGRAARVPVVVAHEHTWDFEGQPLRRLLDRRLIGRYADAFVAVSEADQERMISREGVPAGKVRLMPNGVEPAAGEALDLRAELGLAADVPLIGTACILRPQKALEVLLEALLSVPAAHLVVAGDGPERAALAQRATALGVAERVHFLGLRDDVGAVVAGLDVAAISSDFEGTPLFALEAMATGTPLVATAVGGLPALLDGCGVLVPPRDPAALGSAVARLLGDAGLRSSLAARGSERVRSYSIDAVAERFGALYTELLAR
ncbi:MAG TPA: glycosyltransferase [Solirubrobacteraceae bacterium]|nr:glycosyltransferase [Solirubrobacteraceae bacterium]